jgi:hypothetical protein
MVILKLQTFIHKVNSELEGTCSQLVRDMPR